MGQTGTQLPIIEDGLQLNLFYKILVLIILLVSACNTFDKSGYLVKKDNSKIFFKNAEITDMRKAIFVESKDFYIYVRKYDISEIYIEKKIK